jgi:hypothetical protein
MTFAKINVPLLPLAALIATMSLINCGRNTLMPSQQLYLPETVIMDREVAVSCMMAKHNGAGTWLTVENHGIKTITIAPSMVVLNINDSLSTNATGNFSDYMYFRLRSAKKACEKNPEYGECRQAITRYFMPMLKKPPFPFGTVPPGGRIEGALAFQFLDPFNKSPEARRLTRSLKGNPEEIESVLTVTVEINGDTSRNFRFPLYARVYSLEREKALGLLYFYK